MTNETQNDDDAQDYVTVDAYLEMTARMLGRIHALEATLIAILNRRHDLPEIERHADAIITNDEFSRIADLHVEEATMQTHEWAHQSAHALFTNAKLAGRIK